MCKKTGFTFGFLKKDEKIYINYMFKNMVMITVFEKERTTSIKYMYKKITPINYGLLKKKKTPRLKKTVAIKSF